MSFSALKHYFNHTISTRFLKVLLLIDVMFILGHTLITVFHKDEFKGFLLDTQELGFPEYFQYIKYLMAIALTTYVIIKKQIEYWPFLCLFLFLFIDDVFQIHNRASWFFSSNLKLPSLFFGKLIFLGIIGLLETLFISFFYRTASLETKSTYKDIFLLLILFFFFGIAIDLIHSFLLNTGKIAPFLTLIEEGGEMITLSILVWYFFVITLYKKKKTHFIHELLMNKH
ncbi:hypothetical protein [Cellulophaga sp. Asnod2-G02]|uniref:hypothetical protein n=1 Tax=Cellulophaga sp. Asnod2-G02 TaxID=3160572 RepID=UPI003863A741